MRVEETVSKHLEAAGHMPIDLGPNGDETVDYPDFGVKLAMALRDDQACGIAICGSGIGISIAVNRFSWVRAALVSSSEAARLSRQHNDANVLAFGEQLIESDLAIACVEAFFGTEFEEAVISVELINYRQLRHNAATFMLRFL